MEKTGKQAGISELDQLVSDIAAGIEGFNSMAYALAEKKAHTDFMFEMPEPDKRYDTERGRQAGEIAVQESLPREMGTLAGLICAFESTNQPFDLAQHFLGDKVFCFLKEVFPENDQFTDDELSDFNMKVSHYGNACPLAQTAIMLDLLAMVTIDHPERTFMEWWDQPVIAMKAGNAQVRSRLIKAMVRE